MAGRARRLSRGGSRRKTDWQAGFTNAGGISCFEVDGLTNVALSGAFQAGPKLTLVRVIGQVHAAPQMSDILAQTVNTDFCSILHAGVQIIGRAQGAIGSVRDPQNVDDREGPWLWLDSWTASGMWTDSEGILADWWLPTHDVGNHSPQVDIKVKRVIDTSQDTVNITFNQSGGPIKWDVSVALRLLYLEA